MIAYIVASGCDDNHALRPSESVYPMLLRVSLTRHSR